MSDGLVPTFLTSSRTLRALGVLAIIAVGAYVGYIVIKFWSQYAAGLGGI